MYNLNMKHQSNCYRNIKGKHYINYIDLIMSEQENEIAINEAKRKFASIRKIKHPSGYYQLFVSEKI
jgi:hypothetical protein